MLLKQVAQLDGLIEELNARLEQLMAPLAQKIELLDTIPGVDRQLAQVLAAEVGVDMSRFPTAVYLAKWAGMCPGSDQSAHKRRNGRTGMANRWLRVGLVQGAWAASHTKNTYLSAQYRRLAARRGRNHPLP